MSLLPDQFADLEPLAGRWSLATETQRSRHRLASSMEDMAAFAQALLPQLDRIFAYLDQFPLDKMPEEARRLFYLTLSLAEVAPALETYGQPR
ncbi:MAG: hypothetical protein AB7F99_16705, partial [Vicinamibacterales bacterium]